MGRFCLRTENVTVKKFKKKLCTGKKKRNCRVIFCHAAAAVVVAPSHLWPVPPRSWPDSRAFFTDAEDATGSTCYGFFRVAPLGRSDGLLPTRRDDGKKRGGGDNDRDVICTRIWHGARWHPHGIQWATDFPNPSHISQQSPPLRRLIDRRLTRADLRWEGVVVDRGGHARKCAAERGRLSKYFHNASSISI